MQQISYYIASLQINIFTIHEHKLLSDKNDSIVFGTCLEWETERVYLERRWKENLDFDVTLDKWIHNEFIELL